MIKAKNKIKSVKHAQKLKNNIIVFNIAYKNFFLNLI